MAVLDIRRRTGWLFLTVIVGHVILISTQVNNTRGIPLLEAFVFGGVAELQRGASSAVSSVEEWWERYFALQDIRAENARLKAEMARLQIGLQQERAAARQTHTLEALLGLRTDVRLATTGAMVIGGGVTPDSRTVTIDKGTGGGVQADMAVIVPAGVVGRVVLPTARAAKVQLLVDQRAAAGALIERSRAQGVVVGLGTDRLRMEYVADSADVKVGDRVVTSGIEGIYPVSGPEGAYPKGFVIGQIESIQRGGEYKGIIVKPAVDFSSLEMVLVVLTRATPLPVPAAESPAAAAPRQGTGSVRQGER